MARLLLAIGSALREGAAERAHLRPLGMERTTPRYRLLSIEDRWAALVDVGDGAAVEGLLCEVDEGIWREILASEPPGVTQEPVELESGRDGVTAAFADVHAQSGAKDISSYGSFLAYLAARNDIK
jgi:hypothetical protein